jgi:preprotein translocase subunit SecB
MTKAKTETSTASASHTAQPEFAIHRIFVKDLSFEAPNSPKSFKEEWQPQVDLNLDTTHAHLEDDLYDVTLKVTVNAKIKDKTVFVVEAQQAGIFLISHFDETQKNELLGSFCPNVLFPYVREVISEVINRGGFPPLYLAPVNFDAIYQQRNAKKTA